MSRLKNPAGVHRGPDPGVFADMSAKVRKIIGILDRIRVKYLFSAALILLFAQLVFGASAPRSVFAAAAPDSTRTHDSIPAYTLPEAAAEVPEVAT